MSDIIDSLLKEWPSYLIEKPDRSLLQLATSDELDDLTQGVLGSEEELLPKVIATLKARQAVQGLMHNPKARKQRSANNLKMALDWLRLEPYCDVEIMSLVLGIGEAGARKALNKFVRDGWLVRDEVAWVGMSKKKHLFGVSSKGLYHLLDADGVEPGPNRDFKRGRANPTTGPHILGIQLVRIFHQRLKNPENKVRRYRAARDLPNFGDKHYRWPTYPDAVIEGSPVLRITHDGAGTSSNSAIAVEIEFHHKGSKRYKELIRKHLSNISDEHYDMVIYYLPDQSQAGNLNLLFRKIIEEQTNSDAEFDEAVSRFQFESIEGLAERMQPQAKVEIVA